MLVLLGRDLTKQFSIKKFFILPFFFMALFQFWFVVTSDSAEQVKRNRRNVLYGLSFSRLISLVRSLHWRSDIMGISG